LAAVTIENLSKRYEGSSEFAVKSVSLAISDGEFMVLLGPSGCGKSSVLRMIAGLEPITAGTVAIDGRVVNHIPAKDRNIAMVFQSYALYPHMDVYKNLAFGLRRRGVPNAVVDQRVRTVAASLGLGDFLKRKPHALSGGQRQRVALGRAIVRDPQVFLFDEPLSNLDAALRVSTRNELIKQQLALATTTIYVTHDQVEAMTMGHRICIMNKGAVVQIGAPLEVYHKPVDTFVAKFLGNPPMNLIEVYCRMANGVPALQFGRTQLRLLHWPADALEPYENKPLILGIRPEDLYEDPKDIPAGWTAPLSVRVVAVEALGAETLLLVTVDEVDIELTARIGRNTKARVNDNIEIALDLASLHLFDPSGGRAIAIAQERGRR
jgi:multiple sugar transport system ATP-binding protein